MEETMLPSDMYTAQWLQTNEASEWFLTLVIQYSFSVDKSSSWSYYCAGTWATPLGKWSAKITSKKDL